MPETSPRLTVSTSEMVVPSWAKAGTEFSVYWLPPLEGAWTLGRALLDKIDKVVRTRMNARLVFFGNRMIEVLSE